MEEWITNYKSQHILVRFLLSISLGTIPGGVYFFFFEGSDLQDRISLSESGLEGAQASLERAKGQRANRPRLEEELAEVRRQLELARLRLPQHFEIDRTLEKTATLAKTLGIDLQLFDPGEGAIRGTRIRYFELNIEIGVIGKFPQIAAFFDRLLNMEKLVRIKNISLISKVPSNFSSKSDEQVNFVATQQRKREKLVVKAKANLVIFRSLSANENRIYSTPSNIDPKETKNGSKGA